MTCQMIGIPPTSTIGFGRTDVSSPSRVPNPPARITTFVKTFHSSWLNFITTKLNESKISASQDLKFLAHQTPGCVLPPLSLLIPTHGDHTEAGNLKNCPAPAYPYLLRSPLLANPALRNTSRVADKPPPHRKNHRFSNQAPNGDWRPSVISKTGIIFAMQLSDCRAMLRSSPRLKIVRLRFSIRFFRQSGLGWTPAGRAPEAEHRVSIIR